MCNVHPAPIARPPSRIHSASSGSTWAAIGDAIYSWNGTTGKIHNLDVTSDLVAVAAISDSDVWAVGEASLLAHWNGSQWTTSTLSLGSALSGVFALATNDVWAVGNFGVVGHWNGSEWSAVSLPGSPALQEVWAVSANDVWAGEWNGGLWHYDGTWTKVTSAGTDGFGAVWSPGAGDVWALGDDVLYRGNASSVAPFTVPGATAFGFDGVWGSSSTDVWLSDAASTFHFANGTWTKTAGGARWITGRSASDIHAIGDTHVRRFDGGAWSDVFQVGFPALKAAWRSPNGDVWFAGAKGTILRARNGELRRMTTTIAGAATMDLGAVWGSSDADVWFGGSDSSFLHLVNGDVCRVKHPGSNVSVLSGSAADDVWAIAAGKGMHWDGTTWTASSLESAASLVAFSKTDAWATGGAKVHRWNGSVWSEVTMPVTIDSFFTRFGIVAGTAPNDVWIPVSQFGPGELLHWDGNTWTKSPSPGINHAAVSARASNDVWMLDWDVHHFDGLEWKKLTKIPRRRVSAAVATTTELWIATTEGGVLRLPR